MITIGIDNGSTGSIGVLGRSTEFLLTPTQDCLHYGKKGTVSQRLDRPTLKIALGQHIMGEARSRIWKEIEQSTYQAFIERPFTGKFMNACLSARSFFEATIITLEDLGIGYEVVDSGDWQKNILGNVKGSANLKHASMLRGIQMYPQFAEAIKQHGDADGLLIAHYFHHHGK